MLVDAAIQVVPLASNLHVRLVHQPGRADWPPVPTDLIGQRRPELLGPTQDRPAAHVDAPVGQNASDALSSGAQLQVSSCLEAYGDWGAQENRPSVGTRPLAVLPPWRPWDVRIPPGRRG